MIQNGVRQGCVMSPILFNIYTDRMMREWTEKVKRKGIQDGGALRMKSIRFAEDQCIILRSMPRMLNVLNKIVRKYKMEINENKTGFMRIGKEEEKQ